MTQLTKVLIILAAAGALSAPVNKPRQLGGEGGASDALISDTDNASGYMTENALIHLSHLLGGDAQEPDEPGLSNNGGGSSGGPPPPPPKMAKRQLDKAANGAAAVANALGLTGEGDILETDGDAIDGQLTGDGSEIGTQLGTDEEDIGERVGNLVPEKLPNAPAAGGVPRI